MARNGHRAAQNAGVWIADTCTRLRDRVGVNSLGTKVCDANSRPLASWHGARASLRFSGINFSSPFADLAIILGLQWLATLLFIDAVISPSGTGMTYTATTARMLYGMERNGTLPKILGRVHPKWGVPRPAMWVNLARVLHVPVFLPRLGRAGGGDLGGHDHLLPDRPGQRDDPAPHRAGSASAVPIGGPAVTGRLAFIMSTELLYWAKWPLTGEIILLMVVALPVYFYYQAKAGWHDKQ